MLKELEKLGAPGWTFFSQEGAIMGRHKSADRDIEIDLNGFGRLESSETITTQVFAYVSFAALIPIHIQIDEALPPPAKPWLAQKKFHVHERETFAASFSSNWKIELQELLRRIETWSASLTLERSVSMFAANRPDEPSVPQINHLVGLAYLGDFSTLEEYARTFEKGFALNFLPMITRETIEAALAVAYDSFVERKTDTK